MGKTQTPDLKPQPLFRSDTGIDWVIEISRTIKYANQVPTNTFVAGLLLFLG